VFLFGIRYLRAPIPNQIAVSTAGFERLAQIVRQLNLPTVIVQEGGYLRHLTGKS